MKSWHAAVNWTGPSKVNSSFVASADVEVAKVRGFQGAWENPFSTRRCTEYEVLCCCIVLHCVKTNSVPIARYVFAKKEQIRDMSRDLPGTPNITIICLNGVGAKKKKR